MKEATARIKINKLLEAAGWRFFPEGNAPANIRLEPSVTIKPADLDALGENVEAAQGIESDAQDGTGIEEIDMKAQIKAKRDLFAELSEGMTALAEARQGKRTLRTHAVEFKPAPEITAREVVRVRQHLKLSRALFATYLRTNVRTLENWEQGRAKPNAQAALLINLVRRFPDTVERLAAI